MVDIVTSYTAAVIIDRKKKIIVVGRIFKIWLAFFGAPKKFHSDCGGEFVNHVPLCSATVFEIVHRDGY